jgi:hypothetical protein
VFVPDATGLLAGVALGMVNWGVFVVSILPPPPSFCPQEVRIITHKTGAAKNLYFIIVALAAVKLHKNFNKEKCREKEVFLPYHNNVRQKMVALVDKGTVSTPLCVKKSANHMVFLFT